jgi:Na+-driven multidrug efflux pump
MAFAGAALVGTFFFLFPSELLAVFGMNEPVVVDIAVDFVAPAR